MSVTLDAELDTRFAVTAATVLEQALDGAVVLSVGRVQDDDQMEALLPEATVVVLAGALPGDDPVCLALAVAPRLQALLEESSGADAVLGVLAEVLGQAAAELGVESFAAVPSTPEAVWGAPGSRRMAVPLVEGGERLASLIVRIGPDLAVESADDGAEMADAIPHEFAMLDTAGAAPDLYQHGMELIQDVEMQLTVELGRARMTVRELLSLRAGAIVELDQAAGSPVDILVNGTTIARGEVVVIDEEFGIRIAEIVGLTGNAR
jgi:flagellar motor switch protein FliN/FliY